jgi:D-aminopeptidase
VFLPVRNYQRRIMLLLSRKYTAMNSLLHTPAGLARGRALTTEFEGTPGPNNAITDVNGVLVGYTTLIEGHSTSESSSGPVRTGVTAILPRPHDQLHVPCFAGSTSLNGNGELSGLAWIEEAGELQWPITLTNTHSCGLARDATVKWTKAHCPGATHAWLLPVAGETCDAYLNDIDGFHVQDHHVFAAIESAAAGAIELGSVGGGTGMTCFEFKGGSGSASRVVDVRGNRFTVGVFVQANFGRRQELTVLGRRAGKQLSGGEMHIPPAGSVIAVLATDAPLLPHQVKRLTRRIPLGLARTGAIAHNGSGDIFVGFSTAPSTGTEVLRESTFLANAHIDPLFEAVVQATEEAVIDSMVANAPMTGYDNHAVRALPHNELRQLLG